ncbi:MAG: hypothetical protein RIM72_17790 [Alphaproteobacteria bacterium]
MFKSRHAKPHVFLTSAMAVFLFLLAGCAAQRDRMDVTDTTASDAQSIAVVVTARGVNACWTNQKTVADAVASKLSSVYPGTTVALAENVEDDQLVFQVFGWVFRRSGLCFGNFRVSAGRGLETTEDGLIEVRAPVAVTKRSAILASPETMNARSLTFAEDAAQAFAKQIGTMR